MPIKPDVKTLLVGLGFFVVIVLLVVLIVAPWKNRASCAPALMVSEAPVSSLPPLIETTAAPLVVPPPPDVSAQPPSPPMLSSGIVPSYRGPLPASREIEEDSIDRQHQSQHHLSLMRMPTRKTGSAPSAAAMIMSHSMDERLAGGRKYSNEYMAPSSAEEEAEPIPIGNVRTH